MFSPTDDFAERAWDGRGITHQDVLEHAPELVPGTPEYEAEYEKYLEEFGGGS